MSFKYSVVCDTLKWAGYDVLQEPRAILAAVKEAGYDGADLPGDPARLNARLVRQIVDELGLKVPEVLGAWAYFHAGENRDLAGADEQARQRGVEYSKRAIDLAVELGAQFFEICAAQPPVPQVPFPELPIQTLRENFTRAVAEICAYASARGVTILFEPLNLYEAYPGVLTSVYDALRLIDELGRDNLGIQPDVFHMNISESSVTDALRAAGRRIKVVHMNETNHYRLGAGHADFPAIVRTLKEIDFDGYVSIYMPLISQQVFQSSPAGYGRSGPAAAPLARRPDLRQVLAEQIGFLKEIERAVDAQRVNDQASRRSSA
ncbi:MAG: sugar phosphate isomerase/epimerase [Planctomycetes bacterium]|nr:sugar phosphate isomerase/epimerase [Planctomycetota bacterium]